MSATVPLRPTSPRPSSLGELAALLGVAAPPGAAPTVLRGVTHDSRSVRTGDLYVALPGSRRHGADFAADAAAAGAAAILTDPVGSGRAASTGLPVLSVAAPRAVLGAVAACVYADPTAELLVLGVTGTNGKTTTAYLLDAGLRRAGHTTGLLGTVETRVAGQAVPSLRTTPEATDLQALFAAMRERGVTAVAMEVSSHALALGRVTGTRFAAGLFTNLSQDHLDFHATMDDYFATKAQLFDGRCAHEVVNVDDVWGRRLVRGRTVTVSAAGQPRAEWRAAQIRHGAQGTDFAAYGPGDLRIPVTLQLFGGFNVSNALVALAALHSVGVDPAAAAAGFADLAGVPGRMELVCAGQPFLAVVDYAHEPAGVAASLATLRELTRGRVICVLGCGGDRDRAKRPLMGAAAARGCDVLVITDDNPRSEDPAAIRAAMLAGALRLPEDGRAQLREVADRRLAIAEAVGLAGARDGVLVAGKGHETGQEIAGVVHPFDDRAVLRELLVGVAT